MLSRVNVQIRTVNNNEGHPYLVDLVLEHAPTRYTVYAAPTMAEACNVRDAVVETVAILCEKLTVTS